MIWWPEESPTLKSGTITMRPMRPSDAEDIYRAAQDPTIPKFTTLPENYPLDLAIEFAGKRAAASFANKTELVFVIEDSRLNNDSDSISNSTSSKYPYSNNFAGVMSLHSIDIPNHRAEIGYWLAKEARGKGICTKAAEMITEYGYLLEFEFEVESESLLNRESSITKTSSVLFAKLAAARFPANSIAKSSG